LSGEVIVIRLTAEALEPEGNERLWRIASEDSYRLRENIAAAVHTYMGPEFDVRSMSFARGSLELLVVVGTLYYAVSRYKNFVESIELLIAQLKRVTAAFFGPPRMLEPVSVQGNWTPGPGWYRPHLACLTHSWGSAPVSSCVTSSCRMLQCSRFYSGYWPVGCGRDRAA
jgi:hypothetical protein